MPAESRTARTSGSTDAVGTREGRVEQLWLGVLQRLAGGVAHELRNALNGVAVNVEVVRSRAQREGVPATALGSFATAAADQVEHVIAMSEALIALARAPRQPATVGRIADQVGALLRPSLAAAGGTLQMVIDGEGTTRVPAEAARLFAAAALQAVVEAAQPGEGTDAAAPAIVCRVQPKNGVELRVDGGTRRPATLDDNVRAVAAEYGVGIGAMDSGITLTFPA